MKKFLLLSIAALALAVPLSSCAPFSRQALREVDRNITLQEVQRDPQPYLGKTVLWGGTIIETVNRDHETVIRVAQTDLDFEKRPTRTDRSAGRFIVRYPQFLDPAIYQKGRELTVVGEVLGKETLPLGEVTYSYPVIRGKEVHLWEKVQPAPAYAGFPPWWWYGPPYSWYGPPYWWYP